MIDRLRRSLSAAPSRIVLLRISVILGLLAGLALSPKLWLSSRLYPFTPVWSFVRPFTSPADRIVFFALIALLIAASVVPRREILTAVFMLLALLAIQDQSRWQPWFYQYALMLLAITLAGSKRPDAALNTCCLIVAATYIWSGLAKLNPNFVGDTFPWLVEPFVKAAPARVQWFIRHLAFVAPVFECGTGVGLLTRRFRGPARVLRNRNPCFHPHHHRPAGAAVQYRGVALEPGNDCVLADPVRQASRGSRLRAILSGEAISFFKKSYWSCSVCCPF